MRRKSPVKAAPLSGLRPVASERRQSAPSRFWSEISPSDWDAEREKESRSAPPGESLLITSTPPVRGMPFELPNSAASAAAGRGAGAKSPSTAPKL